MSPSLQVPPFGVLAAALRKTTEHLARELVAPSDLPPDWSDLEWAIARSAAAMQGISALLASRLRWAGPPDWQHFLVTQREQSLLRHARIGELLERIDACMRTRDVGGIALKGSALRALGVYAAGERPMGDIDLLVATRDLGPVAGALADNGYTEVFISQRHAVYAARSSSAPHHYGEHIDNPLKIEVHTAIAEALPIRKVELTSRLLSTNTHEGLNAYPSLVALLQHLLLHAAGNMRAHALRQIQLHDIAVVAPLLAPSDWQALLESPRGGEGPWWTFPPLELTSRYYLGSIPAEVLRAARAACPRVLRFTSERLALTDVSWSNLRIHAFPGIEWSRSALDVLRFMRSRVLPSRIAIAELELARQAQPQLGAIPWYGVSHANRILRWVSSRPPRVQTMVSVRAALESRTL